MSLSQQADITNNIIDTNTQTTNHTDDSYLNHILTSQLLY